MKRWARSLGACGLIVVGCAGLIWGFRAAAAQLLYSQTRRRGIGDANLYAASRTCARAYRLYPYNYRFPMLVSAGAWAWRSGADGIDNPGHLKIAKQWGDRGYEANSYREELRLMRLRFLRREDPQAAVHFWEAHVEWQFWSAYNHFILLQLYADVADIGHAAEELAWVRGSPYEVEALRILELAWAQDRSQRYISEVPESGPGVLR